jgi:hypothetical protein
MLIRKDKHGLYIRSRWYSKRLGLTDDPAYRPGYFSGHSHAWDTSSTGLNEGDKPKTSHVNGAPFIKITRADGSVAYWGSSGRDLGDFPESVEEDENV